MWGVIGGSGFEKFDDFEVLEELPTSTPFGEASSGLKKVSIGDHQALFISRHGAQHELLPSEVNYRANVYALKKYGAKSIVSFSAIGSLKKEYKPGDMVVPVQYIDRTKGFRKPSFCGEGVVGHVSLAHPVDKAMLEKLKVFCDGKSEAEGYKNWGRHFGATYVCIEGPYFSTQAESNMYQSFGANIIGMTHYPEFALVREAGLAYLPCCFVTDYDCWDDSIPHVTVEEVIQVMRGNNSKAFELLKDILQTEQNLYSHQDFSQLGLKTGLFSPREQLPKDLELLLS